MNHGLESNASSEVVAKHRHEAGAESKNEMS
jgi:hypothetical protein